MTYSVVIPSAGIGSRVGPYTKFYNKALISLGDLPVISRIINQYPQASEIIVLLGYKGDLLKEAINFLHDDNRIRFIDVDLFEGPGSSLSYSLACARDYLQCPFIFNSNDSVFHSKLSHDPTLEGNFVIGYNKQPNDGYELSQYRTLVTNDQHVAKINPKGLSTRKIYTGVCGVADFEKFWHSFDSAKEMNSGEVQGLINLKDVVCYLDDTWLDTGCMSGLKKATDYFSATDKIILQKENEAIWFHKNKVVKFSVDQDFISNRIQRLNFIPNTLTPEILEVGKNCFSYKKINGEIFTKKLSNKKVIELLDYCENQMWSTIDHSTENAARLTDRCKSFYKDKTFSRVKLFHSKYEFNDRTLIVNDLNIAPVIELLENCDWSDWFSKIRLSLFHGDFHNENIIVSDDGQFKIIDWRQDFGEKNLEYGDTYYDLAKFMHGLIVSHPKVHEERYSVEWVNQNKVNIDIDGSFALHEARLSFEKWLDANDYCKDTVYFHVALIYLNIAALHEYPYSEFLYLLGCYQLQQILDKRANNLS